jgi:hypothetical protein
MSLTLKETQARRILNSIRAYRAASIVESFGWAVGVLGVISGTIVFFIREESDTGSVTYIYHVIGIAVALASVLHAAAIIMVATYVKSRVSDDSIIFGDDTVIVLDE